MHPTLFHLGHLAFSTEAVLVALGLLLGLQASCLLAPRLGLAADRIWNLGIVCLLTLFLGERLLVIAFNLQDFVSHPFWMLGLTVVRDERYFYGGVALAICVGLGYIAAWRLPWIRVADCLAPGAGLALAAMHLGDLAAGSDFGRRTSGAWGVVYTSHVAAHTAGTPLHVPLLPIALYAGVLQLILAAGVVRVVLGRRQPGTAAAFWLLASGCSTVLLQQFRYSFADETLVAGVFTPTQAAAILAIAAAAILSLRPSANNTETESLLA